MKDIFLKAKHWHLFLLICGFPFIVQLLLLGMLFSDMPAGVNPKHSSMLSLLKFVPLSLIIFAAVFFGWFWSVGVRLQRKIPENVKMKVTRFKILFMIPIFYVVLILFFIITAQLGLYNNPASIMLQRGAVMILLITMHFFSLFCIFYSMYFAARTIKTAELQKYVTFSDFAIEFFLIWFYPVGIWIIQPKINKMIRD